MNGSHFLSHRWPRTAARCEWTGEPENHRGQPATDKPLIDSRCLLHRRPVVGVACVLGLVETPLHHFLCGQLILGRVCYE